MRALKEFDAATENRLLANLPREEYERLSPHLEPVLLKSGQTLYNTGDHVHHAYFPRSGMLSLLSTTEAGRTIEVGMIGNEGMAGLPVILLNSVAPYHVMVQIGCNALRVREEALREEFLRGGRLQTMLLRYTHVLITQVAQSAACNRFHAIEKRLCRWLLISRDRMRSDVLHLTQEFISHMLGAPRTSVTAVAGRLQERGLISYRRGKIVILDGPRMESASCECYRRVRDDIRHLLAA